MNAPNAELAYRVLDQIDAHPETWDQGTWDCGTTACFAGWAVRMSGGVSDTLAIVTNGPSNLLGLEVEIAALLVLGIDSDRAEPNHDRWLFGPDNTREDLGRLVAEIFGPRPGGES